MVDDIVQRLLDPNGARMIVLWGYPGSGKTEVAVAVGHRVLERQESGFTDVLWHTFRSKDFLPRLPSEGVSFEVSLSVSEVVQRLSQQVGCSLSDLNSRLKSSKYLIILDNLDTAIHAGQLLTTLTSMLGQSKALLTSRWRLEAPYIEHLPFSGLDEPGTITFLREEARYRGVMELAEASNDTLARLSRITEGLPLALHLIVSYATHLDLDRLIANLQAVGGPFEKLYQFLFGEIWKRLSASARNVLVYLGATAIAPVSIDEMVRVAFVSNSELDKALLDLCDWHLIEAMEDTKARKTYDLHTLTRNFVSAGLGDAWKEELDEHVERSTAVRLDQLHHDALEPDALNKLPSGYALSNYVKSMADSFKHGYWSTTMDYWQHLALSLRLRAASGELDHQECSQYASQACTNLLDSAATEEEKRKWRRVFACILANNADAKTDPIRLVDLPEHTRSGPGLVTNLFHNKPIAYIYTTQKNCMCGTLIPARTH